MAASPTTHSSQQFHPQKVSFARSPPPTKMSVTQTFYLAHKARGKLSSEASRSDHNLRLLVGHANLLDTLMIHLAEAEEEQEQWYQNTVRGVAEEDEEHEEYGSLAADYESDSESESDEEYEEEYTFSRPRFNGPVIGVQEVEEDYDDDYADAYDEDGMFELTRTTSHRPPSLCSDESDDDEDEATPPSSPAQPSEHFLVSQKDMYAVPYFDHEGRSLIHDAAESMFEERLLPTMVSSY